MILRLVNPFSGDVHVDATKIVSAWRQGASDRYVVKFGRDDTLVVDKESFEKVVEWLDSGVLGVTEEIHLAWDALDKLKEYITILFARVAHDHPKLAWKSRLDNDGAMLDGMFLAGLDTPYGQAACLCDLTYWDIFDCEELKRAPELDTQTPDEAFDRIRSMLEYEQYLKREEKR